MSTLVSNSKATWNKFLGDPATGIVPNIISSEITTLLGRTVDVKFFSQVEINDYPCIRSLPLRRGSYFDDKHKLASVVQIDIFVIDHDEIVLDLIVDKFFEHVGFDLSNNIFHSRIDLKGFIENRTNPSDIGWMEIRLISSGFESRPTSDPKLIRVQADFQLLFRD